MQNPATVALSVVVSLAALSTPALHAQRATRPVAKLFISVDMEGITGVIQPSHPRAKARAEQTSRVR
jgi:hypothetical protein